MVLNQITHVLLWYHTVVYGNVLVVIYSRVSLPANSCPFSFFRARYSFCSQVIVAKPTHQSKALEPLRLLLILSSKGISYMLPLTSVFVALTVTLLVLLLGCGLNCRPTLGMQLVML